MSWETPTPFAADVSVSERVAFIRRTYAHLAGAVLSFVLLEAAFLNTPFAEDFSRTLFSNGRFGSLLLIGGFILAGRAAHAWAASEHSPAMQYAGLGLYVVAEAIIFVPLMYLVGLYNPNAIAMAGIFTALLFTGLTGTVFIMKSDFSWMSGLLSVAGFTALGVVIVSMLFGFSLGVFFSGAMVALAAGYVLYETSNVLHRYPTHAHVSAALALFASVALMFYYLLRLLGSRR